MNANALTTNNLNHNATVPTTIGALLTEENTIDPLSPLPSFLELTFVDVARNSGRVALSAAWDVGVVYLKGLEERLMRLEQMMIHRVVNLRRSSGDRSKNFAALKRIVSAVVARLRLCYYTRLRRICYVVVRCLQTLAPELQSLVMFTIDYHCMHYLAGSTACEMVYGLKRSKVVNGMSRSTRINLLSRVNDQSTKSDASKNQQRVVVLTSSEKTKSAVLAALIPYWKEKCDKLYSDLKEQPSNSISQNSFHLNENGNAQQLAQQLKNLFMKLYPFIHLTHEGSIFLYQFAYLLEYTPYWSFSLHALGLILRRITVADIQQKETPKGEHMGPKQTLPRPTSSHRAQRHSGTIDANNKHSIISMLTFSNILRGALVFSVSYTLLSGWYRYFRRELSLRRRRWIAGDESFSHQDNTARNGVRGTQPRIHHPIPPPPLPPVKLKNTEEHNDNNKWACPLCHEPRINPTASTAGVVYCYKCLILRLRRDGEFCPLTGTPCKESQVVRLYESTVPSSGGKDVSIMHQK